jgi:hypothetical protein
MIDKFIGYVRRDQNKKIIEYRFGRIAAKNVQGKPNNRHYSYTVIWEDGLTNVMHESVIDYYHYIIFNNEKEVLQFKLRM